MMTSEPQTATAPHDAEDAMHLTVHLRDHGRLEIATILHVQKAHSGLTRYGLEIDTINAPRRFQMVLQQATGTPHEVDDRVYLLADPQDERKIFVLPQSATGGQKLPRNMNRLDPYVLGPLLLRTGARGTAHVLTVRPMALGNPDFEARGFRRFDLTVRIEPANHTPSFEASQQITLTSDEKIRKMATVGASMPIRYDILQPQCFTVDSLAMGYPDPYAESLERFRDSIQK